MLLCIKVADVSEAVRQYADALMLSGESAIGSFGQKALAVLDMASSRMESWSREENRQNLLNHHKLGASLPDCITEQICNCAVEMGNYFHILLATSNHVNLAVVESGLKVIIETCYGPTILKA